MADEKHLHDADESMPANPQITWKTRRRMAVICMWAFLWASILTFLVGLWPWSIEIRKFIMEIYQTFTMACVGVIFGYMGTTTLPFIGRGWKK